MLLARSYREMQRYADAAEAYRNLMRLIPDDADGYAGYGEMLTAAANGTVGADGHAAFVHALELDRDEPRAQFYLGLERAQAGDTQGAIAIWRALTASAPADASWLPTVRAQMAELAQSAGVMPMSVTPRHALEVVNGTAPAPAQAAPQTAKADPAAPNMGALTGQYSPENIAMIQGMVGGLAAKLESNPDDFNGWMLLGRSYTVLKNLDGAKQAYVHALRLKPADDAPKAQLNALVLADAAAPSPALVKLADELHKADAGEPLALYILGQDRAAAGDGVAARTLWRDAAAHLPADAPLKTEITRRMATLK
jgi:cytochrome c-type biogenesis protein CcmH